MNPKVLVLSNECFSKSKSNGRTLGNFFHGWPKENLAQFYLSADDPDFDVCSNYFRVTDRQALSALKNGACDGGAVEEAHGQEENKLAAASGKKKSRNALAMLGRNLVWQTGRWKNCGFDEWVDRFSPNIALLQAGDCAFMFRLAVATAKRKQAKLVIYNSEGYYFKNFDYFRGTGMAKLLYPMFHADLKAALKRAYLQANYIFYACDELKQAYGQVFDVPSETIYTASDVPVSPVQTGNRVFTTSYCGNLGLDRHKGLILAAEQLQKMSPELFLDVYGKAPNDKVKAQLEACPGIHFHGLVSYEEVKQIIKSSDLLLHVESFDTFYQEDLKFAFSTKIADLLSSGKCFLLFAPEQLACSRYLRENKAAYVVSDQAKLASVLEKIISSPDAREKYRQKAIELAEKNHTGRVNVRRFQSVLKEIAT